MTGGFDITNHVREDEKVGFLSSSLEREGIVVKLGLLIKEVTA